MIQFNEYLEIGTKQISYKYKKDTPGEQTNMKREKFIPKNVMDEDVPAFMGALAQAAKDGKKDFKFGDKTYKVKLKKDVADKITNNMKSEATESDYMKLSDKELDELLTIFENVHRSTSKDILKTLSLEKKRRFTKESHCSTNNKKEKTKMYFNDKKTQKVAEAVKRVIKSKEESNAFTAAAAEAKLAGKTEFEFEGKKYPVKIKDGAAKAIANESVELQEGQYDKLQKKLGRINPDTLGDVLKGKIKLNPAEKKEFDHFMKGARKMFASAESVEMEESVELQEAADFGEIEKVMKWAKKNLSGVKLDISKKYGTAFINLTIMNVITLRLGGKKGIVVIHDDRTNGKGKDYEEYFSNASDVIKFVQKVAPKQD